MNNENKITPNLPLWSYQLQQDSKLAVKTRKNLEIHLITRALKDEAFRHELITNPKAVIEEELGTKLPDELEIKVLEETEDTIYMVLPCNPYEGLSEEELQASLGMTYEDVAQWVYEQHSNSLLDEESNVKIVVKAWFDETFKQDLLLEPSKIITQYFPKDIQEGIRNKTIQMLAETTKITYFVLPRFLLTLDLAGLKQDPKPYVHPRLKKVGLLTQTIGHEYR